MKAFIKSQQLKKILIRKNKSQNWFADRIEVSSGYMSQLMEGSRCPSAEVREKIMQTLPDAKFDQLFQIKD